MFNHLCIFSRMRSKVPVSLWGSGRWGCVRSMLPNRSQPSAWGPYGRASGKFCRRGAFCRFQTSRCFSFRVAGVALRDIQACFVTCRKSFCVAGAILLQRFQKMRCIFRGRRSTLDVSIVMLRGRRSTLDVSCCVFFANRIGRAASSGDKVQIPWHTWRFVWCAEKWRKPRTKHRFWDSKISGSWANS